MSVCVKANISKGRSLCNAGYLVMSVIDALPVLVCSFIFMSKIQYIVVAVVIMSIITINI